MRERFYDTQYIIKYTKEIYDINLTKKEIRNNNYESIHLKIINNNVFDEFRKEKSINIADDDYSRKYFNGKARNQYLDFLKFINRKYINKISKDYIKKCFGITLRKASEVHHVHPLMYGGSNQLENLLALSGWTHRLLHDNPLERYKKYCFHALDYLNYIGNYSFLYHMDKNNIFDKSNGVPKIAGKMMSNVFEEEMYLYYHELKSKKHI